MFGNGNAVKGRISSWRRTDTQTDRLVELRLQLRINIKCLILKVKLLSQATLNVDIQTHFNIENIAC